MLVPDKIIFFDGECGLCNRVVDLLIRIDKTRTLHFASLQSQFAKRFFTHKGLAISALDTIYFYRNQQLYQKSSAVKQVLLTFNNMWGFLGRLMCLIPRVIADYMYDVVAKNRFKVFGKTMCRIPTVQEQSRFLT